MADTNFDSVVCDSITTTSPNVIVVNATAVSGDSTSCLEVKDAAGTSYFIPLYPTHA